MSYGHVGSKTLGRQIRVWMRNETLVVAWSKLVVSLVFCILATFCSSLVIVLVNERIPDKTIYPPLPDILLDNLPVTPWAFTLCEYILLSLEIILFVVLLFHKGLVTDIENRCEANMLN
jgi:hypothetical protein